MDSETHLLSVTVLNRDFVCSGITVFHPAFFSEKALISAALRLQKA